MALTDVSDVDLAWLAGLFEGEGNVAGHHPEGQGPRLAVVIKMTDEDVVRRCHEITGIGRVHGPYLPSYPGGKPYWGWSVQSARDAYLLMRELYPLLGERRRRQVIDKALPWMLYRPQPRNRNRARTADGRLA